MREHLKIEFDSDSFSRLDETDDALFFGADRFVDPADATALATVERIVETLVVEDSPVVLDLMAGPTSRLPATLTPARVVGLGLNAGELARNPLVTESVVQDLNRDTDLEFPDSTFDVVLNVLSVDYLTRPLAVFREVNRVLRPGGLFLVVFSNRIIPEKAVKIWRQSSESVRVDLVNLYFDRAGGFDEAASFASIGMPRPKSDRSAGRSLPSDPVYAVYADKLSEEASHRPRPQVALEQVELPNREAVEHRKRLAHWTLRCPYCDELLTRWHVPDTPFNNWDAEYLYVCLRADCPYTLRSHSAMHEQGNVGLTCRLMYHRERDCFYGVPDIAFGGDD